MENEDLMRIQRVSRRFRLLFSALVVILPLLSLIYWLGFNHFPQEFVPLPIRVEAELSLLARLLGFVISMLPIGVVIAAMYILAKLFNLYEKGIVFASPTVKCFRQLGWVLMFWVLASLLYLPMLSGVVTSVNPPGQRLIAAQLGLSDFVILLMGAIVVLISWVMDEARKLEEEQAHTV
ncbi:DUF2975 domain-containing protein [Sulfuriflexus mobilis]|uniref:DUF2975 domain-containing protein n=1 Tax=Sulfuriflexus mobilis TaxID=1811807 RepID=UPI000F84BB86|nr:DUF2975 domain-containing protein [Sulfuriflexus mobilis]